MPADADISVRKVAKVGASRRSAGKRREVAILEGLGDGFYAVDRAWRITYFNRAAESFFGKPRDMVLERGLWDVYPQALGSAFEAACRRAMADGASAELEVVSLERPGHHLAVRVFPTDDGIGVGFRDITERRLAEEALRRSEMRYRSLIAATTSLIWTTDAEGRHLDPQPSWERYTGQSRDAASGQGWSEAVHPEDRAEVLEIWSRALAERSFCECTFRIWHERSRAYHRVIARGVPVLEPDGSVREWIGSLTDIEDKTRAEAAREAALRTERRYAAQLRALASASLAMTSAPNVATTLNEITFAAQSIIGAHVAATTMLPGHSGESPVHALSLSEVHAAWRDKPMPPELSPLALHVCKINKPLRLTAAELRMHQHHAADEVCALMQMPLRGFLAAPLIAKDGGNLGLIQLSDREEGEFTEEDEAVLVQLAQIASAAIEQARSEEALRRLNETLEQRVEEALGERLRAEAELQQLQKMEALGQLTGGVAHDFNNLLTGVLGNLELAQRRVEDGKLARLIGAAMRSAQRGAELTTQLLAFARKQHLAPQPVDVNRLVRDASDILRRTLGGGVSLDTRLAGDLWPALADPTQIELVLLNLAINARDAMPEGGSIVIQTANVADGAAGRPDSLRSGDFVRIAVTDTGTGMSPDVIARAFEPFFTTKQAGKGSGLGLSQVYGVASQSGGTVRIRSELGRGTTVEVFLPRSHASERLAPAPAPPGPAVGRLAILVVEDHDDVRNTVAAQVEALGYAARVAASGSAALELIVAGAAIDVLIADYAMPGMSGAELIREAAAQRPELPAIIITGYANTSALEGSQAVLVLKKPFGLAELGAAIERAVRTGVASAASA